VNAGRLIKALSHGSWEVKLGSSCGKLRDLAIPTLEEGWEIKLGPNLAI
jgi:hypothetical protein